MNYNIQYMPSFVVNPHFSKEEIEKINEIVKSGGARSRADFVRIATLHYIERESFKQNFSR